MATTRHWTMNSIGNISTSWSEPNTRGTGTSALSRRRAHQGPGSWSVRMAFSRHASQKHDDPGRGTRGPCRIYLWFHVHVGEGRPRGPCQIYIWIHVHSPQPDYYLGLARQHKCLVTINDVLLCVLLCFIDTRVRKIRNEASSCPGIRLLQNSSL